jgi:hypothetical protein
MTILARAVAGTLLSLVLTTAHATIIFDPTPSGTGSNVLFQTVNVPGNPLFGNLNDAANTLVQFNSNQTLIAPPLGQARIESVVDGQLTNLVTTIPGSSFFGAVYNLDATADGTATISVLNTGGITSVFTLPLDAAGENFFTLTTADGQQIASVTINSTVGLDDVSQIRLQAVPGPIVGAGLPGLLAACVGLLALARRRRRLAIS